MQIGVHGEKVHVEKKHPLKRWLGVQSFEENINVIRSYFGGNTVAIYNLWELFYQMHKHFCWYFISITCDKRSWYDIFLIFIYFCLCNISLCNKQTNSCTYSYNSRILTGNFLKDFWYIIKITFRCVCIILL